MNIFNILSHQYLFLVVTFLLISFGWLFVNKKWYSVLFNGFMAFVTLMTIFFAMNYKVFYKTETVTFHPTAMVSSVDGNPMLILRDNKTKEIYEIPVKTDKIHSFGSGYKLDDVKGLTGPIKSVTIKKHTSGFRIFNEEITEYIIVGRGKTLKYTDASQDYSWLWRAPIWQHR